MTILPIIFLVLLALGIGLLVAEECYRARRHAGDASAADRERVVGFWSGVVLVITLVVGAATVPVLEKSAPPQPEHQPAAPDPPREEAP